MPAKPCLACGGQMESGFVLDRGESNRRRLSEWWAGEPKKSIWSGVKKPDRTFQIEAQRCTRCGFLMQFANPEDNA